MALLLATVMLAPAHASDTDAASTSASVGAATQQLAPVLVQASTSWALADVDAASEGRVPASAIASRPSARPGDVLELVPGLVVTQHSGEGKANQYFLRGFDLDHGTDFATWLDGMPVNMPTHAHGQGYSDLNGLIPELVSRIDYRKGPYFADEGDFASAGTAHIHLIDRLPRALTSATLGERGYERALVAHSTPLASGQLLGAFEAAHNDGPWRQPEHFHRTNGLLRWSTQTEDTQLSLTAMAYAAGWHATDQIPLRAVQRGLLDRFGSIDPSDGGRTSRASLSLNLRRSDELGEWALNAYAIRSRLTLHSDFSYFLDHPSDLDPAAPHGDQFEQSEARSVLGGALSRRWNTSWGGHDTSLSVGLAWRHDGVAPLGLYSTVARQRVSTIDESRVKESSLGVYAQTETSWRPWLRSVVGVRADRYRFAVASSTVDRSGHASAGIATPKLSLVLGPWRHTELFLNLGHGFHSNDARGVVAGATTREAQGATARADALVRTRGREAGLRAQLTPQLQTTLALWELRLGSELVFAGDTGETEPSRASWRSGIEWSTRWAARPGLTLAADLSLSRARYDDGDPQQTGNHVPGSAGGVASLSATLAEHGPWSGEVHWRWIGPRPLTEDNRQRSPASSLASLRVAYRMEAQWRLALDVFNLFDRRASDIEYFYASRLPGEPAAGVADRHLHPVEPRTLRLTLSASF